MATSFEEIYKKFLFKVKAYELQMLLPEQKKEILQIYLEGAITLFYRKCKVNLQDIDYDLLQFNETISLEEKNILSEYMVVEWLRPQLLSDELLESRLNTKDFTEYSTSKLIEQIRAVYNIAQKKSRQLVIDYTYNCMDIEGLTK